MLGSIKGSIWLGTPAILLVALAALVMAGWLATQGATNRAAGALADSRIRYFCHYAILPFVMLNHLALRLLAQPSTLPTTLLPSALQLFADYDLSLPRRLLHQELDSRYAWRPGTSSKLVGRLINAGLLNELSKGVNLRSKLDVNCVCLAREYTWTPKSLADQWRLMDGAEQRMDQVQGYPV